MTTEYPGILKLLLEKLEGYREGHISLDALKAEIWNASEMVSSFGERNLRQELEEVEGRLDITQFAVDQQNVLEETLKITQGLEETLRKVLGFSASP